jgi:hypothetical protein
VAKDECTGVASIERNRPKNHLLICRGDLEQHHHFERQLQLPARIVQLPAVARHSDLVIAMIGHPETRVIEQQSR